MFSGTGALAVAAARTGGAQVTAVDISIRAMTATWLNAHLRGLPIRVEFGDALSRIGNQQFDVVLANPPYVPSGEDAVPRRGRGRSWDAAWDGRALLDPLCAAVPGILLPGGMLLVVHSAVCNVDSTLIQLRAGGLKAAVVARQVVPFGPVMRRRRALLERRGLIEPGQCDEELVVIRGDRPQRDG